VQRAIKKAVHCKFDLWNDLNGPEVWNIDARQTGWPILAAPHIGLTRRAVCTLFCHKRFHPPILPASQRKPSVLCTRGVQPSSRCSRQDLLAKGKNSRSHSKHGGVELDLIMGPLPPGWQRRRSTPACRGASPLRGRAISGDTKPGHVRTSVLMSRFHFTDRHDQKQLR
jgi:hypothetical protein